MPWYGGYGGWAPYVPVARRISLGHAAAKKRARQEKREPCPVQVHGRKIAKTFWGVKWCENLERYGDFANRLPRGATYVRNGSVADLMIEPGRIRAIVGGSQAYTIDIRIAKLPPAKWKSIRRDCSQQIDSLMDLLRGRFSDGVMRRLTHAEGGLFPHKKEISMRCSCPDFAQVCKHIAATFYGVAARLDDQPELLFTLRNVEHLELVRDAAASSSLDEALGGTADPTLATSDLGTIFGIDLETGDVPVSGSRASRSRPVSEKTKIAKKGAKAKKATKTTKTTNGKKAKQSLRATPSGKANRSSRASDGVKAVKASRSTKIATTAGSRS
ncbi:MAG: hypothetical protein FJ297_19000 [Planctomycetes bacterium]|nr:hypothetical protein [Planctomycetota bacterium]